MKIVTFLFFAALSFAALLLVTRDLSAQNAVVAIAKESVVIRAKPVPYALKIGALDPGTEVAVLSREGAWLHVLTQSGARGWVDNSRSDLVVKKDSWAVAPRPRTNAPDQESPPSLEERVRELERRVTDLEARQ